MFFSAISVPLPESMASFSQIGKCHLRTCSNSLTNGILFEYLISMISSMILDTRFLMENKTHFSNKQWDKSYDN